MAAGRDELLTFFFRPQGRIGRTEFALGAILINALSLAVLSFMVTRTSADGGVALLLLVVSLPLTVAFLMLAAKRCHDMGLSGAFLILLFIPIVGIGWLLALFFLPGTNGPNLYGPQPQFRTD